MARTVPRRKRARGAILLDTLFAIGIVAIGAAAVYGLMPTVYHGQAYGNQRTIATQMGARMAENLQMLSSATLNAKTLTELNLIDAGQSGNVLEFSHIPLDEGARYSPSTALPKGKGILTLSDLPGGAVKVVVTVSWTSPFGASTYKTGTVVGGYR